MREPGSMRRWLALVGVLLLAATVLFMGAASGQEVRELPDPAPGILPPGDWTPEQVAFAKNLVRRVEDALPEYVDRETLAAQGYRNFGVTAPGGWDHWGIAERNNDDRLLDPDAPESLVLRDTPEGYRIEAALFILPDGSTMDDVPADIAWLPGWHHHDGDLCVNDDRTFAGLPTNGTCSAGHLSRSAPMLHVWTVDNPCNHRFPGIGVGGIDCGHHGGTPPGTFVIGPVPPGTVIPPAPTLPPGASTTTTSTRGTGTAGSAGGGSGSSSPVPVRATPRYAG